MNKKSGMIIDQQGRLISGYEATQGKPMPDAFSTGPAKAKSRIPKLFKPDPVAAVAGGLFATSSLFSLPVLWSLAAIPLTAVATGYGARWGQYAANGMGEVFGAIVGSHKGITLASKLSKLAEQDSGVPLQPQEKTTILGMAGVVGANAGAAACGLLAGAVGYAAGGVMAYKIAKADIENRAFGQPIHHQQSLAKPVGPLRAGENKIQLGGKTHFIVIQNG